ncbi:MAG: hypothetical protein ACE5GL_05200 [Calditrichia bacterium]
MYGNSLISHVAGEHYLHGILLGHLERQTGVGYGALIKALQKLASVLILRKGYYEVVTV